MRKGTFIIFAIIMIGLSNCAFESKLEAQFQTTKTMELRQNSLGKALLSMLNMQSREKRDMSELFEALDQLKESLVRKTDDENTGFDADGLYHAQQVDFYNNQINTFTAEEVQLGNELDTLQAKGVALENDLQTLKDFIAISTQSKEAEEAILKNLKTEFEAGLADYATAIELLQKAAGTLTQALESSSSAFDSFIQTNQIMLQKIQLGIETHVNKITFSPIFAKPLVNIFAQIQSGNKLDDNTIQKALTAVRNLIVYFENGLEGLKAQYDSDNGKHTKLVEEYTFQIKVATFSDIPMTETSIQTNSELQSTKKDEIKAKQRDIKTAQDALVGENESWDQRVQMHNDLLQQFDKELKIVEQAIELLQSNFSQQ